MELIKTEMIISTRKKLIDAIRKSDNEELLEELFQYVSHENDLHPPYRLSQDQKTAIDMAREQYEKGDFLSDEDADKDIESWIGE
jgi:hypothetical protein